MSSIIGSLQRVLEYLSQDLLRRVEIRYRLITAFILLSLLPVLISGYISYAESTAAIKEKAEIFSKEVVKQVSRNVVLRMEQIETESSLLVLSDQVQSALMKVANGNAKEQNEARLDMTRLLLDHYGSVDFINEKYLLDTHHRVMDTQAFAQLTRGVMRFVKQAPDRNGRPYWGSYDNGVGQLNLGMVRAVIGKSNNRRLGYLVLVIRPEHFSTIFNDVALGTGTQIYVLDSSNNKLIVRADDMPASADATAEPGLIDGIAHNTEMLGQPNGFVSFEGKNHAGYFAAYTRIPGTTWFVVSTIPEKKLTAEAQSVRNQIVLVGISGFLLSIFFAWFISHSISSPLKDLVRKMHDTGSDAGAEEQALAEDHVDAGGQDELGRLAQRFERMRGAIRQKIQKINEINASLEQTVVARTAELVSRELESRTLIENSPDTITRYDRDLRRTYANPAFCTSAGRTLDEALGKRPSEIPGGSNALIYERKISEAISTGKSGQFELRWVSKDGQQQCSHIRLTPEIDPSGKVNSVLAVGRDLSDRMAFEAAIWKQANFDTLTQLPNRQMFQNRLEQEAKIAQRSGHRMALMLIDLDRFKEVNDSLGHDTGDTLLIEAARRIRSCVREADTVARLGGDEFTVILPNLDHVGSIERIARTIIDTLSEPFTLGPDEAFISASIGVTLYPDDASELDVLFKNADQAMYAAKNAGRNCLSYFTQDLQIAAERRLRLTSDLRAALPGDQFRLYYQPIVDLTTGDIYKAEALVRWLHPERGMISPLDFIPLAEDTGLIVPIGDWVFRQAVQQAKHWRNRFHSPFQISVNVSPVQIRQDNLVCSQWSEYLHREGMPGQSVAVEITEGLLMHADLKIDERLMTFRNAGIRISIDDFGTGYSSLAYLKRFEIDFLKIDRSFVQNLGFDADNQALCEAMVVLAHKLGLKVIAEGVETVEQRDFLMTVGCDFAQGFLYSPPVPPDQFEALVWPRVEVSPASS
ncbi:MULTISPECIES: bifunctional diguanylate cyclase/phosphodiesterase [Paraburkholderia]|uniref:Diguanylate cyclase n=1 Tax=Paraburkholderia caribensis TaxID=75105 RepID=A0A9Q6SA63_9BURK|nr:MULTISPECIES: EAL domain-containing protein [Paraburkholderia]MCO4876348.1 EAL domain-containing protein [Paraburkholderia caribensis]PTB29842.1 sensor domain-containing diguanylate cyclase [Paraburkholderia caribensis]QLB67524.1 diguanylate cyclase [Paraburkholderia caribensis]CAG9224697.1 Sensor domain-containing diguanylate cyclase [Paraburkholderia caribensis]